MNAKVDKSVKLAVYSGYQAGLTWSAADRSRGPTGARPLRCEPASPTTVDDRQHGLPDIVVLDVEKHQPDVFGQLPVFLIGLFEDAQEARGRESYTVANVKAVVLAPPPDDLVDASWPVRLGQFYLALAMVRFS
jgi:hypothetical protein